MLSESDAWLNPQNRIPVADIDVTKIAILEDEITSISTSIIQYLQAEKSLIDDWTEEAAYSKPSVAFIAIIESLYSRLCTNKMPEDELVLAIIWVNGDREELLESVSSVSDYEKVMIQAHMQECEYLCELAKRRTDLNAILERNPIPSPIPDQIQALLEKKQGVVYPSRQFWFVATNSIAEVAESLESVYTEKHMTTMPPHLVGYWIRQDLLGNWFAPKTLSNALIKGSQQKRSSKGRDGKNGSIRK